MTFDAAKLVMDNIYMFGIRGGGNSAVKRAGSLMAQGRINAKPIHTHTVPLDQVPMAIKYAR